MDINKYRQFCKSTSEGRPYLDSIQKLVDLEKKYQINLDDYIPYEGNETAIFELDSLFDKKDRYSEKLFMEINSYFRYKLYSDTTDNKSEVAIFQELSFNGTEADFEKMLTDFMDQKDAERFVKGLSECSYLLDKEQFRRFPLKKDMCADNNDGMIHLLLDEYGININISALSLLMIALVLDVKLTLGVASAVLGIVGKSGQAIVKLDVPAGEECLIREALLTKKHLVDSTILPYCSGECVNNDLPCNYREDGKCTIKAKDVVEILDSLSGKNVFTKIRNSYKYNF